MTSSSGLTARQCALRAEVLKMASMFDEQMMLVSVMAPRFGCSSGDIEAVREALIAPVAGECGDQR